MNLGYICYFVRIYLIEFLRYIGFFYSVLNAFIIIGVREIFLGRREVARIGTGIMGFWFGTCFGVVDYCYYIFFFICNSFKMLEDIEEWGDK
jgi:hypothetical protein